MQGSGCWVRRERGIMGRGVEETTCEEFAGVVSGKRNGELSQWDRFIWCRLRGVCLYWGRLCWLRCRFGLFSGDGGLCFRGSLCG